MNAVQPIRLSTPDGSGQAVHPDVIRIDPQFQGYRYWMAFTPYPFAEERLENPCIRVSHDGYRWTEFQGCPDPVVDEPQDPLGHHADTELAFWNGRLFLLFMTARVGHPLAAISYTSTDDGRNWHAPRLLLEDDCLVSPSVAAAGSTLHLWYVQCCSNDRPTVSRLFRRSGPDLDHLGQPQLCEIAIPGHILWHLDIIAVGRGFEALLTAYPQGKDPSRSHLFHATSVDGITFELSSPRPLLSPTLSGWDNRMIYRSSFLYEGQRCRLWYSAASWGMRCGIGYASGRIPDLAEANPTLDNAAPASFPTRMTEDLGGVIKYLILRYMPVPLLDLLRRLLRR